jgi:hypothetical protein
LPRCWGYAARERAWRRPGRPAIEGRSRGRCAPARGAARSRGLEGRPPPGASPNDTDTELILDTPKVRPQHGKRAAGMSVPATATSRDGRADGGRSAPESAVHGPRRVPRAAKCRNRQRADGHILSCISIRS